MYTDFSYIFNRINPYLFPSYHLAYLKNTGISWHWLLSSNDSGLFTNSAKSRLAENQTANVHDPQLSNSVKQSINVNGYPFPSSISSWSSSSILGFLYLGFFLEQSNIIFILDTLKRAHFTLILSMTSLSKISLFVFWSSAEWQVSSSFDEKFRFVLENSKYFSKQTVPVKESLHERLVRRTKWKSKR